LAAVSALRAVIADDRRWRWAVLGLALAALLGRLLIAAHTGGGNDLRVYYWFAHLGLEGHSPYYPPATGFPFPARLGDNLPAENLLFVALLKIHDAKYTLRAFFALADAGVIALVGLYFPRPRTWRAAFIVFYAVSPLVLGSWTATSEDKTFLFLLFTLTVLCLERERLAGAWSSAAVNAALKGFSLFWAPMLAVHSWRARGLRYAAIWVAGFVAFYALSHLPWYPDGLQAYHRRDDHIRFRAPGHAAPTQILSRLGIYDPKIVQIGVPLLLIGVFLLYWREIIGIVESLVLAAMVALVLQSDHSYPRALFAALPFFYVIRLDRSRWITIWIVSTISAIVVYFQQERGQLGGYGSLPHVLFANLLLATVLIYYVRDKLTRRPAHTSTGAPPECDPTSSPAPLSPTTS
jgi:hypothetical protein